MVSLTAEPIAERFRKTRGDHARETAADYAELIADLLDHHGEARVVDLAERLGTSHVTVVRTVQRLARDGYVASRPYRGIFLTAAGRELAEASRARHRIVRDALVALGVRPHTAEQDAEGMEHHVSPETLMALRTLVQRSEGGRP